MTGINPNDIAFIIPGPKEFQTLYLKNGSVVVLEPFTGRVMSAVDTPGMQEINKKKQEHPATPEEFMKATRTP